MNIEEAWYEQRFEIVFLRCKGNEFQTFFERLMGLAYKANFMACRPWGNRGDRKNDGFLKSERRLFQVYAPNEMTESKAIKKIEEDFEGALPYWGEHFDQWTFVHNATDGLPPHVQKVILDFEKSHTGIKLDTWGLEELRLIFWKLTPEDKQSWLGSAPAEETKRKLGFEHLKVVLENIALQSEPIGETIREVSPEKLDANGLSKATKSLLKSGFMKAPLVEQFFNQWHDANFGERIATAFKDKYSQLKESNCTPNEIFTELQRWAGGPDIGTSEHQLAVLTVIAYYFESCNIFEEPSKSSNDPPLQTPLSRSCVTNNRSIDSSASA